MKVSFPYMGTVVVYKKILELLGHEVYTPPRPSKKTLDLGVKYSPEFACFPFKTLTGTYMEIVEEGVDAIVTSGGHGPCRAGFYSEIHKRELQRMGYDLDVIVFDSYHRNKELFMENVRKLKGDNSWLKVISTVRFTYKLIQELDKFDKRVHQMMAYEVSTGKTSKAWDDIQRIFDKANNKKELNAAVEDSNKRLTTIELNDVEEDKKIRIGIVGEIYVVMESSINMDIEKTLGELGCETEKSHYLSGWVDHNMVPKFLKKSHEEEIIKKGEQYIKVNIGGHAKETVGQIVDFKDRGFDGIIHLMPFGCLPELISSSIIPKVSKEYDIPILSISLDEQTGKAHSRTRLEAFIDLIKNNKLNKHSA